MRCWVRQPFGFGPPSQYELRRMCADNDANWLKDTLARVDREAQVVHTDGGETVPDDALLVAVGGRESEAFEHVTTFRDAEADEMYQGVVQDVEQGYSKGVAFLLPDGPVWPLPLYISARLIGPRGFESEVYDTPPWPEDQKVVAEELGPYLAEIGRAHV